MDRSQIVEFFFTPIKRFEWWDGERCMGDYIPGMRYNCPRDEVHDKLRDMCAEWEKAGQIQVLPLAFGTRFEVRRDVGAAITEQLKSAFGSTSG